MSNYTPALEAGLKALSVEGNPITFASASEFAEAHGLKVRSVVAKIKSMKLPYEPKPTKVTKTGAPVVAKATIVATIEAALGIQAPSLEKATKADLDALVSAIANLGRASA
jgi:hypothetical protein